VFLLAAKRALRMRFFLGHSFRIAAEFAESNAQFLFVDLGRMIQAARAGL
jgi:hypothetical protein